MTYLASSAGALITDRNTWHTRADQAWGASRVWNSGSSFETDSATWHTRADQAWGPSRVWSSGNSFETNYNNLLAGLNSPDGETQATGSPAWPGQNATSATTTLTIPRDGHFVIAAVVDGVANLTSFGSTITVNVGGLISANKQTNAAANSGTQSFHAGWVQHGDYTQGQTLTVNVANTWIPTGSITIQAYAHFVPTSANHN